MMSPVWRVTGLGVSSSMRDAKDNVSRLNNENANLRAKVSRFRERYRTLLENEITSLDSQSDDLLADLEREFYPASMQQEAAVPESFAEPVKPAEETPAAQPEVKSVKQTPAKTYDSDSLEDMTRSHSAAQLKDWKSAKRWQRGQMRITIRLMGSRSF